MHRYCADAVDTHIANNAPATNLFLIAIML